MIGGAGNDTYYIDASEDIITEVEGEGIDSAISTVSYTLASNVENLTLSGTDAVDGTGNGLNNVIIGNNAPNGLFYTGGLDTLDGAGGSDTADFSRSARRCGSISLTRARGVDAGRKHRDHRHLARDRRSGRHRERGRHRTSPTTCAAMPMPIGLIGGGGNDTAERPRRQRHPRRRRRHRYGGVRQRGRQLQLQPQRQRTSW